MIDSNKAVINKIVRAEDKTAGDVLLSSITRFSGNAAERLGGYIIGLCSHTAMEERRLEMLSSLIQACCGEKLETVCKLAGDDPVPEAYQEKVDFLQKFDKDRIGYMFSMLLANDERTVEETGKQFKRVMRQDVVSDADYMVANQLINAFTGFGIKTLANQTVIRQEDLDEEKIRSANIPMASTHQVIDVNRTDLDEKILNQWEDFGDTPMDPETETLEEPWNGFPAGTHREEVWEWFENTYEIYVGDLLNQSEVSHFKTTETLEEKLKAAEYRSRSAEKEAKVDDLGKESR